MCYNKDILGKGNKMFLSTQQVRDFAKQYGSFAIYTDKTSAKETSRRSVVFKEYSNEKKTFLALVLKDYIKDQGAENTVKVTEDYVRVIAELRIPDDIIDEMRRADAAIE
jgi:predicted regulator of amino acid metabolism with ACT domain